MTIATVTVTAGALRNHHFHLTTVMDMFPSDAIGGKNRNFEAPRLLRVDFGGNLIANTDIDGDKNFFRDRRVQRLFFERNAVKAGDKLIVERNGTYEFSVRKAVYRCHSPGTSYPALSRPSSRSGIGNCSPAGSRRHHCSRRNRSRTRLSLYRQRTS